ncbi:hypothetical protein N9O24_00990 [bacterium]|nr:hypothetical protein [bacterium]
MNTTDFKTVLDLTEPPLKTAAISMYPTPGNNDLYNTRWSENVATAIFFKEPVINHFVALPEENPFQCVTSKTLRTVLLSLA